MITIWPSVFIVLVFVAVILMITLDMADHTVAALIGAAIFLIFLIQIWPVWAPLMIEHWWNQSLITPDPGLAAEYESLMRFYQENRVFTLDTFTGLFGRWVALDTIIVIIALMVITEIERDSGFFQFIAVQALKLSGGSTKKLFGIFAVITFLLSTVLATTALIMVPLTIVAADALEQDPTPYLITSAMVGNAGGITTLIASVPNMLVAGATAYDFIWFVLNLMPLGLILLFVTILVCRRLFRRDFTEPRPQRVRDLMELDAWSMVEDRGIFYRTAILFALMIAGFVLLGGFGLTWMVALIFALVFVVFSGIKPERLFREVEWTALFFFIGLFILVGGLEEFFVLEAIGNGLASLTGGDPIITTISFLWVVGFTSGAVDNIPVTATLVPIVEIVGRGFPSAIYNQTIGTLWASLVAGAVLGGALTPIASAANVLTMTVARKEGRAISYSQFLKVGILLFFIYLSIATVYMLIRLLFLPILPPPIGL